MFVEKSPVYAGGFFYANTLLKNINGRITLILIWSEVKRSNKALGLEKCLYFLKIVV